MKKLLSIGDRYLEKSDWKTIALLKFCLFSLGLLFGLEVCEKGKRPARMVAGCVFLATYIPLMAKLFCILKEECCPVRAEAEDEDEADSEADAEDESEPDPEQEM